MAASMLVNLGDVQRARGQFDAAHDAYLEAYQLVARSTKGYASPIAAAMLRVSRTYVERGEPDAAVPILRELQTRMRGKASVDARLWLAAQQVVAYAAVGDEEAAARVDASFEEPPAEEGNAQWRALWLARARRQLNQGRVEEARKTAERALSISERLEGRDSEAIVEPLALRSHILLRQGKVDAAIADGRRALEAFERFAADHDVIDPGSAADNARAQAALAGALSRRGDTQEATRLRKKAREFFAKMPKTYAAELAALDADD